MLLRILYAKFHFGPKKIQEFILIPQIEQKFRNLPCQVNWKKKKNAKLTRLQFFVHLKIRGPKKKFRRRIKILQKRCKNIPMFLEYFLF
jgi:hypothetical protein